MRVFMQVWKKLKPWTNKARPNKSGAPAPSTITFRTCSDYAANTLNYAGDGTSGLYLWGAQLEQAIAPSTYIPTTTAAVTRSVDSAYMRGATNFDAWYNPTEGTLVGSAEVRSVALTNRTIASLAKSTSTAYEIYMGISRSVDSRRFAGVADFTTQASYVPVGAVTSTKIALGYKLNDTNSAMDGVLNTLDTACTIPTALTTLYLGDGDGANAQLTGWLKQVSYYPKRIADTELVELSKA